MWSNLSIEQQKLSCNLCTLSWIDRNPRVLPCLHTFCCRCLEIYLKRSKSVCPTCEEKFKLPKKGVKGLPKNILFSDHSGDASTSNVYFCNAHNSEISLVCYKEECHFQKLCVKCIYKHENHTIKPFQDHCQINEGLKLKVKALINSAKEKIENSSKFIEKDIFRNMEQLIKNIQDYSLSLRKESFDFYNNKVQFLNEIEQLMSKSDSPEEIEQYQSLLTEMHYRQEKYSWKPLIFRYLGYDGKFGEIENAEIYSDKDSLSGESDMILQETYEALWESKLSLQRNGVQLQKESNNKNDNNAYRPISNIEEALKMAGDEPPPLPQRNLVKNKNENNTTQKTTNFSSSILQKFKDFKLSFPNLAQPSNADGKKANSKNVSKPNSDNSRSEPEPIPTYSDEYDESDCYDGDYWGDTSLKNDNNMINVSNTNTTVSSTVNQNRRLPPPPVPARNHNVYQVEYHDLNVYVNENSPEPAQATAPPLVPKRRSLIKSSTDDHSPVQETAYLNSPISTERAPDLAEILAKALKDQQQERQRQTDRSSTLQSPVAPKWEHQRNFDSMNDNSPVSNQTSSNQSSSLHNDLTSHPLFSKRNFQN